MKVSTIKFVSAAMLALSFSSLVQAQLASNGRSRLVVPDLKTFDLRVAEAQVQMQRMHEQMDRLRKTTDPNERQALLNQHWVAMQNAMNSMRGMWGPGMMGCCGPGGGMLLGPGSVGSRGPIGWGGMHGHYSRLTSVQLKQREYMLDQYIGMQQMVMHHILMRQEWMAPTPTPSRR